MSGANGGTPEDTGLEDWVARHADRLAARFLLEDADRRGDPATYFERNVSALALTPRYRPTAERVFAQHLQAAEGGVS